MAGVSGVNSASSASSGSGNSIADMTSQDFLKLLITELSNQDPFEPMKNKEILEQLSAIRSLESNMTMTENFQSLVNNQQLVSATALIGRAVMGTDANGELIVGLVDSVSLDASGLVLNIGDRRMAIGNVMQIVDEAILAGNVAAGEATDDAT